MGWRGGRSEGFCTLCEDLKGNGGYKMGLALVVYDRHSARRK